jgi:toxin ParE1/3/4
VTRKLVFSEESMADLRQIGRYTKRHWGDAQKARYMALLQRALSRIQSKPSAGQSRDALSPGMRCYLVGSHAIYFRCEPERILVIRVLHGRMDAPSLLVDR